MLACGEESREKEGDMLPGRICCLLVAGMLAAGGGKAFAMSGSGSGTGAPHCGANEVQRCTLGPPPVCQCVPAAGDTKKVRGVQPVDVGGAKNGSGGKSKH